MTNFKVSRKLMSSSFLGLESLTFQSSSTLLDVGVFFDGGTGMNDVSFDEVPFPCWFLQHNLVSYFSITRKESQCHVARVYEHTIEISISL
jgi:hypothetical protein